MSPARTVWSPLRGDVPREPCPVERSAAPAAFAEPSVADPFVDEPLFDDPLFAEPFVADPRFDDPLPADPFSAVGALPEAPARVEQVGHAPHPCERWTLVATAICCSLVARSAVGA
ncbi:hypothetical protein ABZ092_36765 [Streptomyces bobili]